MEDECAATVCDMRIAPIGHGAGMTEEHQQVSNSNRDKHNVFGEVGARGAERRRVTGVFLRPLFGRYFPRWSAACYFTVLEPCSVVASYTLPVAAVALR